MKSVHVWYLRTDQRADALLTRWSRVLSAQETERARAFVFDKDRRAYVAAHGLLRVALARYLGVPPERLSFASGPHGRPEIAGAAACSGLRFSLTHTDGLAACALARDAEVGVDVEATTRPAAREIVERCFAPAERRALLALSTEQQQERFFEYWTLKEAFLKAIGRGLAYPMDRILFTLTPEHPPRVALLPELEESADAWQFSSWSVEENYRIALAVRSGARARRVKIRSWSVPPIPDTAADASEARQ